MGRERLSTCSAAPSLLADAPVDVTSRRHSFPSIDSINQQLNRRGGSRRVRLGRIFRGFDLERFAFREQSAHDSPFLIVEFDFQ